MKWLQQWIRRYEAARFHGDLTAGLIVTALLIPQSLRLRDAREPAEFGQRVTERIFVSTYQAFAAR